MSRVASASALLCGLAIAICAPAFAAEKNNTVAEKKQVIVLDAPDLYKIPESAISPRFSTLLGMEVYSNKGKRIGEIEDFVMAKGGKLYAVIDTHKDPIADLLNLNDGELVIAPVRELRKTSAFGQKTTN